MLVGMALIPLGLVFAIYGLMPRLNQLQRAESGSLLFNEANQIPLNREHWTLVAVLMAAGGGGCHEACHAWVCDARYDRGV